MALLRLSRGEFFGTPTLRRQIGRYDITETRFAPNEQLPEHSHDCDIMIIMAHGGRIDQLKTDTIECITGSIMMHSAGVPHNNRFSGKKTNHVINLAIPKQLYAQYCFNHLDAGRHAVLLPGQSRLLAARIEFEIRLADDLSEGSIDELVIEFSDRATRVLNMQRIRDRSPWITDVLEYLNDCSAEPYHLSDVADMVGRHPAHIARTFRQAIGCTTGTYLRHVRVSRACSLLAATKRPVVEIAAETGFADESHLFRCMRAIFGTSPGRYRRIIAQG